MESRNANAKSEKSGVELGVGAEVVVAVEVGS